MKIILFILAVVLAAVPAAAQDDGNPVGNPDAPAECQYRELDSLRPFVVRVTLAADRGYENEGTRAYPGLPLGVRHPQTLTVTVEDVCSGHRSHVSWQNKAGSETMEKFETIERIFDELGNLHFPGFPWSDK